MVDVFSIRLMLTSTGSLGLGLTGPNFEELGLDVAGLALASFEDGFLHFEEGFLIAL
jgi:hypothetical protein